MTVPVILIGSISVEHVAVPERTHLLVRFGGSGDHYLLARFCTVIVIVGPGSVVGVGTPEVIFTGQHKVLRDCQVYAVCHVEVADIL